MSDQLTNQGRSEQVNRFSDNLAFLYQGLLTVVVRLQAGREQIPEPESFRTRAKNLLSDAEREAKRVGYEADIIKDSSLAVIAFLDSVVLNSSEAGHAEWVRQSLAQDLLQVANAGEVFFDKLTDLMGRRNSREVADVLEVYVLCLLLGFEGRYSERERIELNLIRDKARRRIDEIRGKPDELSPAAALPQRPVIQPTQPKSPDSIRKYAWIAGAVAGAALLLFILCKLDLVSQAHRVAEKLL